MKITEEMIIPTPTIWDGVIGVQNIQHMQDVIHENAKYIGQQEERSVPFAMLASIWSE